ncbi:hypothetical protein B0H10DRAFT_923568 [Mycena sp. CBHHK59/15]|nr:hypothetical protein B0H10DRAFT_923568 [Mycena sp. CBHHK59/15]
MTEATLRGWPEPTGARPSSGGTDVPGEGPVPVGASVAVASGGQSAPFGRSTICDTTFQQWPESHAEESVAKDPVGLAHATCGVAVWEGTLFGGPYSSPVPSVGDFGFMANTFVAAPEGDNLAQQIQDEADTGFNMVCGPTDRRFPLVTPVGPISEPSAFTPGGNTSPFRCDFFPSALDRHGGPLARCPIRLELSTIVALIHTHPHANYASRPI